MSFYREDGCVDCVVVLFGVVRCIKKTVSGLREKKSETFSVLLTLWLSVNLLAQVGQTQTTGHGDHMSDMWTLWCQADLVMSPPTLEEPYCFCAVCCLSVRLFSVCMSVCLSAHIMLACLSICMYVCTGVNLNDFCKKLLGRPFGENCRPTEKCGGPTKISCSYVIIYIFSYSSMKHP